MPERVSVRPILILGLLLLMILIPTACSGGTYAEPMPRLDMAAGLDQKIELTSLVMHVKRLRASGGMEAVYEITADYIFHNPGEKCSVKFSLPAGSLAQGKTTAGVAEVFEDGSPVKFGNTAADLNIGGQANGWGTTFDENGAKNIRYKYYIEPAVSFVNGTLPGEDGRDELVTKAQNIFFSTFEELSLPVEFDVDWVEWRGSPRVEIDIGEQIPDAMVRAYPPGYEYDGGIFKWDADAPSSAGEFKAGFMRTADCLYRIEDAKQIVKALTDKSDTGYLRGLTNSERHWYLKIARNGVFAKHGFGFTGNAREYFDSLAWYEPDPKYSDSLLSMKDREMIGLILEAEQKFR